MPPSRPRASSSRSLHWAVRLKKARLAAGLSFSWTALLERSSGRSNAMPGMRTLVAPRADSPNMEVIYYIFGESSRTRQLVAKALQFHRGRAWELVEFTVPASASARGDGTNDGLFQFAGFTFGFGNLGRGEKASAIEFGQITLGSCVAGVERDHEPGVGVQAIEFDSASVL